MTDSELRAIFILRLWREQAAATGEWRGEVKHVQSARIARFGDPAALFAFVWSELAEMEKGEGAPASTGPAAAEGPAE